MAYSVLKYTGTGTDAQLAINFTLGFLDRVNVHAYVEGEAIERDIVWITDGLVTIGTVASGLLITLRRETVKTVLVHDYSDGSILTETSLDEANLQSLMIEHEILDGFRSLDYKEQADLDFDGFQIFNLGTPVADTNAATKKYCDDTIASEVLVESTARQYTDDVLLNLITTPTAITALSIRNVTLDSTVLKSDAVIVVDATLGDVVVTLLSAASSDARNINIQRSRSDLSSNAVTITPDGTDTIGKGSSMTLFPGEGYEFIPDGVSDYLQF